MKKLAIFAGSLLISTVALADKPVINGVYWPQEKIGQKILLKHGYHDIQIVYIQPRKCLNGVRDPNSVGFRAISKQDHVVTGYVCNGNVFPKVTTVTEPLADRE